MPDHCLDHTVIKCHSLNRLSNTHEYDKEAIRYVRAHPLDQRDVQKQMNKVEAVIKCMEVAILLRLCANLLIKPSDNATAVQIC